MSFVEVIQPVQLSILARLADGALGFNANFAAAVATGHYTLPAEATATPITWTLTAGSNVAFGRIDNPAILTETSNFNYPFFTVEVVTGSAAAPLGQRILAYRFSGPVRCSIQVFLSWEAQQFVDFSSWGNAVIDSLIATINTPFTNPWGVENGAQYAGEMTFAKSPIRQGGMGFLMGIDFGFNMRLNVQ
jgi:hypothetical protein